MGRRPTSNAGRSAGRNTVAWQKNSCRLVNDGLNPRVGRDLYVAEGTRGEAAGSSRDREVKRSCYVNLRRRRPLSVVAA